MFQGMNFLNRFISHFRHYTINSSDNSTNQQCPSMMDNTSANLIDSQLSDQQPIPANNITEVITGDKAAETHKDNLVNDVIDLTTMDSDIMTLDDSQSTDETVQGSGEVPVIDLDEFEAFMDDLGDKSNNITEVTTDDKAAETHKDNLVNDVVDLTTMDSDIMTLDDSQSTNEIVEGSDEVPVIDLNEFETFMDVFGDESDEYASEISKMLEKDEVITLDDIFNPIIESVCRDTKDDKLNESQMVNTDICGPAIESTFKARANDLITESECKAGEHENINQSQTASTDNICDPTIELSSKTVINDSDVQTETQEDTMNVQEDILDNDEVCCLQAPLKSFDIQDFEELIHMHKIFPNEYEFPQSHQEEELTRYLAEIEKKAEMSPNMILEVPSKMNTTKNKENVLESNINLPVSEKSYKNKVDKIKDLNNVELEFSIEAETPLLCKKNAELSTVTNNDDITIPDSDSDSYHSSDFEFISESKAKAEGLYFYKKPLKIPSINSECPSTSKDVVPSSANVNNLKQNCSSVHGKSSTFEETRNDNCEMLSEQSNKEMGTPSLSQNGVVPSTSNTIQTRDYYRALRLKFRADEEKKTRKSHKIPQGQEYLDLLSEQRASMFILQNKSVMARAWCMDYQYQGVGFDAQYHMPHEEVSEEDKKAAEETTKEIIEMYPLANRRRRRRI